MTYQDHLVQAMALYEDSCWPVFLDEDLWSECDYEAKTARMEVARSARKFRRDGFYVEEKKLTLRGRYTALIKSGRSCGISFAEFGKLLELPCHYCKGPLSPSGYSLDRKDNSRDYYLDNVVPCCGGCNFTRGNRYSYSEMCLLAPVLQRIRESHKPRKVQTRSNKPFTCFRCQRPSNREYYCTECDPRFPKAVLRQPEEIGKTNGEESR